MSSKTATHIGKAVSSRRFLAGLSVAELADKVGISRQAVQYIEQGINTPKIKTLEAIAAALGVDVKELLP